MSARRRVVGVVALAVALGACGIRSDTAPRDLPEEEGEIAISGGASETSASGADRIYLVAPGEEQLLRSVPRDAQSREDLFKILLLGPNDDEIADQFRSFIPPDTELISARSQGQLLILDLTDALTELSGQSMTQALAQIVHTAAELEGIETVQIRIEGETLAWLTPAGESRSELRTYDFPNAVQTAQPDFPAVPAA